MLVKYNPLLAVFASLVLGCLGGCGLSETSDDRRAKIIANRHYLHGYPPTSNEGLVNVVIEIPAGTSQKWEVDKDSGHLIWESVGDSLRMVNYHPYPANYGMVPQTLLPIASGGDGDPLDVIVLGPAINRGDIVPCKLIGMLALLDNNERDDKLIAVPVGSHFAAVDDISQLDSLYKGSLDILTTWFGNYKGTSGETVITGVKGNTVAHEVLHAAIQAYQDDKQQKDATP